MYSNIKPCKIIKVLINSNIYKNKDCSHNIGSGSGDGLKGTLVGETERIFFWVKGTHQILHVFRIKATCSFWSSIPNEIIYSSETRNQASRGTCCKSFKEPLPSRQLFSRVLATSVSSQWEWFADKSFLMLNNTPGDDLLKEKKLSVIS